MTEAQIKHMVDRFLNWRLPDNFSPDAGISFKATFNENTPWPMKHEPVGTNLFDAIQAEAMVRHMIEGLPVVIEGLKACPFCGSAGYSRVHEEMPGSFMAGCSDADCIAVAVAYDFVDEQSAINAWNHRVPDPEAASTIETLRKQNQELRASQSLPGSDAKSAAGDAEPSGWRPIESAPKDGTPILVAVTGCGADHPSVVGEAWWQQEGGDGDWWWANTSPGDYYSSPIAEIQHGQVTDWRPLPSPPKTSDRPCLASKGRRA